MRLNLSDAHQYFLQILINKKLIDQYKFKEIFMDVLRKFNLECSEANYREFYTSFLRDINDVIRTFNMEIKTSQCETSAISYFCLIRQCDTGQIGTLSLLYSPMELKIFRRILELVIDSDEGHVEYETISYEVQEFFDNVERDAATQSQTTKKPTQTEIRRVVEKFIQDYWLVEVLTKPNNVTLHGRAIAELSQYIKQLYKDSDVLNYCQMCKSLVLSGFTCESCSAKMHRFCAKQLFKKTTGCPGCRAKFTDDQVEELNESIASAKTEYARLTET
jgi:hypothetical protein